MVILLFGWFISLISTILLPFLLGMGAAYMLDPLADKLERKGLNRTLATSIISVGFFVTLIASIIALVPLIGDQLELLFASTPQYLTILQDNYAKHLQKISDNFHIDADKAVSGVTAEITNYAKNIIVEVMQGLLKSSFNFVNFIGLMLITPLVSFYLLRDWDKLVTKIDDLLPHQYAPIIRLQMQEIDRTIAAFLRGTLNVIFTLVLYYAVALAAIGLPYSLLIAIMSGAMIIIPFIGTIASALIALCVAFVHFDEIQSVALVAGVFIIGQVLEGYVLTPRLVGKHVGLNPLWLIFGMMAGGAILGFVGVLIAVPLAAVLGVLLRFAIAQYKNSEFYHG